MGDENMDTSAVLNKRFSCVCGRVHECSIEEIVIGRNALESVPSLLKGLKKVLVVSDGNTRPLCFDRLKALLEGVGIACCEKFFDQTAVVIPDEASISSIEEAMDEDVQALVGIGSGVISDLCKYVSFTHALPYMIIATAPSMDGYASVGAALILSGMKVTKNAHVPSWIIGDIDILKTAPIDMIRAGIGDILGKYSCLNDWKLASLITGEHMCPFIYDMVMDEVKVCESSIEKCMQRDAEAVGSLMNSLVQVGVAMSYLGNSRPASGSEHHFSHFFEITGILSGREYLPHGIDVAYSAILTAHLREMLAASKPETFAFSHDDSTWNAEIDAVYGSLAGEVKALQKKVGFYTDARLSVITEKWDEICKVLREAPGRREMQRILARAGYEMEDFVKFYGEDVIRTCIRSAKDLKDRYTLLWLLNDVGLLENFSRYVKLLVGWKGFHRELLVAGHRGVRHTLPENTMTAFREAIRLGADMIETDVRMTRDGHLVIMHDETVDRTTNGSGLIRDMTLEEFKALNAADDYDLPFESAPTLREFLELCRNESPDMLIDFELKEYPVEGREGFAYEAADKTLAMVEEFGLADRCVINSFSGKLLEYVHTKYQGRYRLHGYYPFAIMGEMTLNPQDILYCLCMISQNRTADGKVKGRNEAVCPKAWFDDVISQGIIPWVGASLNSAEEVEKAIAYGAELVTTDYPAERLRDIEYLGSLKKKPAVIALDLDGTLTQHKSPLEAKNRTILDRLRKRYKLVMVGAGSCHRIWNQMGRYPIDVIGCYGMQYARYNEKTGELEIVRDETAPVDREENLRRAAALRSEFGLHDFAGETLEFHATGALTFPVLGTKARLEDKLAYDPDRQKRRKMYGFVRNLFPDYNVLIGGSSSFDIVPARYGKLNALRRFLAENGLSDHDVVYCGDDYHPGGNDHDVYAGGIPFVKVDDYERLEEYLTEAGIL